MSHIVSPFGLGEFVPLRSAGERWQASAAAARGAVVACPAGAPGFAPYGPSVV